MTEAERGLVRAAEEPFRAGCISNFALYGGYLILLPITFVGLVGSVLVLLGISKTVALCIGLGVAYPPAIYVMMRIRAQEKDRAVRSRDSAREDIRAGMVEIISFEAQRAWDIEGLEDFGPGYLFDAGNRQFVYAASQQFLELEEDVNPGRRLTIERLPHSKAILSIEWDGEPVQVFDSDVTTGDLPQAELPDHISGCALFLGEQLSPELMKKLSAKI